MDGGVAIKPQVTAMFEKLAGVDGEIDSEELQDMLTVYFSKSTEQLQLLSCQ